MEEKNSKNNATHRKNARKLPRETLVFIYVIPALLVTALIISGFWGSRQRALAEGLKRTNEDIYTQAYTELADSMYNMSISLSKLRVSKAPSTLAYTLDDIWRESGTIVALMGRIPQSHVDNYELNRFLAQVGDYARSLSLNLTNGGELTAEDRAQLEKLYSASKSIYEQIGERLSSGSIPLTALEGDGFFSETERENAADGSQGETGEGNDESAESRYPTPIYDGPFSDSTEKRRAKVLDEAETDEDAARESAKAYLGEGVGELESNGLSNGSIPFYDFTCTLEDGREAEVAVTVNGAKLLYLRIEGESVQETEENTEMGADLEACKRAADDWLNSHGYENMEPTYAQYYPGVTLVNFVATKRMNFIGDSANGEADTVKRSAMADTKRVKLYSDLIKLWVENETGRVIGVDAENYLFSHCDREINRRIADESEARDVLSPDFNVQQTALALIPLDDLTERLCYEFVGGASDEEFIVYIDAWNLDEVLIYRLIDDENGTMTI